MQDAHMDNMSEFCSVYIFIISGVLMRMSI